MNRWFRVVFFAVAVGLIVVGAVTLAGTWMYHGTPGWYHSHPLTAEQSRAAANRADQKIADLFSWVASLQAQNVRRQLGTTASADPTDPPASSKTITLSEDELNAFIQAWESPDKSQLQKTLGQFFTEGRLVLADQSIIVAGQSSEFGTLASAQFDPIIDSEGKLWLKFEGMAAGRLPLPNAVVADKVDRFTAYLRNRLVYYQQWAQVDSSHSANGSAAAVGMIRLLLDGLNGNSSEPILFIPFDLSHLQRALPVKLSAVKVSPGQITLTLQPLSESDQPTVQDVVEKSAQP